MKLHLMRPVLAVPVLLSLVSMTSGCMRNGPEPEVVPFVDVERYIGLWHEIASNPTFFNLNLVYATAEYDIIEPGVISVLNRGYAWRPDGRERRIEGRARVVEPTSNAKLKVQFDTIWGQFFEGDYWIVLLDDEDYQYAVVSDNRQSSMFVLYREPEMPRAVYEQILADLEAKAIDTSRLRITGGVADPV